MCQSNVKTKSGCKITASRRAGGGRTDRRLVGQAGRQAQHTAGRAVVTRLWDKFVRISDFVFRQRLPSLSGSVQIFDGSLAEPTVHRMKEHTFGQTNREIYYTVHVASIVVGVAVLHRPAAAAAAAANRFSAVRFPVFETLSNSTDFVGGETIHHFDSTRRRQQHHRGRQQKENPVAVGCRSCI